MSAKLRSPPKTPAAERASARGRAAATKTGSGFDQIFSEPQSRGAGVTFVLTSEHALSALSCACLRSENNLVSFD